MAQISELFDETEVKDYKSMFESVIKDLRDNGTVGQDLPEGFLRLQKCLEYNALIYSKFRGFLVPFVYKAAVKTKMSESQYQLAQKIGWCVQIHTSLVTLVDDMYDDTEIRFRKPSWWYLNKKDIICMNDTLLVQHAVFRLLEKYLKDEPLLYAKISCCLNNVMYEYLLGTSFELELSKNVEKFTMERYLAFQKAVLGESFFSAYFEIPLWLAKNEDHELVKEIKDICHDVGYIFTVRDDLMDSFGDQKEHAGTHDNDIKRGNITWMILTAKKLANKGEWESLKMDFGKMDKESVDNVKRIYEELGVPELCRKHLKDKQEDLMGKIKRIEERGNKFAKPLLAMASLYTNLDE